MYYAQNNSLGFLGQTSCAQISAHLEKANFLASSAGGRSEKHRKGHAKSAKKLKRQLDACEGKRSSDIQNFNLQVQQAVAPTPDKAAKFWIWAGVLGVVGILGLTAYKLKKRRR